MVNLSNLPLMFASAALFPTTFMRMPQGRRRAALADGGRAARQSVLQNRPLSDSVDCLISWIGPDLRRLGGLAACFTRGDCSAGERKPFSLFHLSGSRADFDISRGWS